VVASEEDASVVVTVTAAAAAAGTVTCIIHVTSANMRTHPFHYYNGLSLISHWLSACCCIFIGFTQETCLQCFDTVDWMSVRVSVL